MKCTRKGRETDKLGYNGDREVKGSEDLSKNNNPRDGRQQGHKKEVVIDSSRLGWNVEMS